MEKNKSNFSHENENISDEVTDKDILRIHRENRKYKKDLINEFSKLDFEKDLIEHKKDFEKRQKKYNSFWNKLKKAVGF